MGKNSRNFSLKREFRFKVLFQLKCWGHDQAQEDKAFVFIAFLNVVWGSMWLEGWKRRSAELTYRWGLQDNSHELIQDPRPEFAVCCFPSVNISSWTIHLPIGGFSCKSSHGEGRTLLSFLETKCFSVFCDSTRRHELPWTGVPNYVCHSSISSESFDMTSKRTFKLLLLRIG